MVRLINIYTVCLFCYVLIGVSEIRQMHIHTIIDNNDSVRLMYTDTSYLPCACLSYCSIQWKDLLVYSVKLFNYRNAEEKKISLQIFKKY